MKKSFISMLTVFAIVISMFASVSFAATTTISSDGVNSGDDAYEIFQNYLGSNPVDGPSSGYIWETTSNQVDGDVFQFHASASGMYDGSNTDRQRNEIKAYGSSPNNVKGYQNTTFTYQWKFRVMNGYAMTNGFNHIFQVKAYGGSDSGAPVYTFSVTGGELRFRHSPIGSTMDQVEVLAATDWDNIVGTWVEATVVVENTNNGSIDMTLNRWSDGQTLMSFSGTRDNWRSGAEFNRPKWGIYRKIVSGMGAGDIQFHDFIIHEGVLQPTSGGSGGGSTGGPEGYTFCANEWGNCNFSGTKEVAYGANGSFNYATHSNGVACTNSVFGDPISGVGKACYTQDSSSGSDFNGDYRIMARHSDKAITVASASQDNGANIFQYTYGGSNTNDEWEITPIGGGKYTIMARHSGKAMVVESASTSTGANVFQYSYGGSTTNDEWKIEDVGGGYYRIVNDHSGLVLDVQGNSTSNSANIQQHNWNGGNNQQWEIISVN